MTAILFITVRLQRANSFYFVLCVAGSREYIAISQVHRSASDMFWLADGGFVDIYFVQAEVFKLCFGLFFLFFGTC